MLIFSTLRMFPIVLWPSEIVCSQTFLSFVSKSKCYPYHICFANQRHRPFLVVFDMPWIHYATLHHFSFIANYYFWKKIQQLKKKLTFFVHWYMIYINTNTIIHMIDVIANKILPMKTFVYLRSFHKSASGNILHTILFLGIKLLFMSLFNRYYFYYLRFVHSLKFSM